MVSYSLYRSYHLLGLIASLHKCILLEIINTIILIFIQNNDCASASKNGVCFSAKTKQKKSTLFSTIEIFGTLEEKMVLSWANRNHCQSQINWTFKVNLL